MSDSCIKVVAALKQLDKLRPTLEELAKKLSIAEKEGVWPKKKSRKKKSKRAPSRKSKRDV
jgi:hypothetical protein